MRIHAPLAYNIKLSGSFFAVNTPMVHVDSLSKSETLLEGRRLLNVTPISDFMYTLQLCNIKGQKARSDGRQFKNMKELFMP